MSTLFELPAELNIYAVQAIHASLLDWVSTQTTKAVDALEVSARDVAEVDGSGLQLLASLANGNQAWHLVDASPVFVEACRTLGLTHWLDRGHLKGGIAGEGA